MARVRGEDEDSRLSDEETLTATSVDETDEDLSDESLSFEQSDLSEYSEQHQLQKLIEKWGPLRRFGLIVVESKWFSGFILGIILLNTILIAAQTVRSAEVGAGYYFSIVDNLFLGIYVFELGLKMFVWRGMFFQSGWNLFDMFIVITSFVEWLRFVITSVTTLNPRIFRLLRVFRAVRALRALRVLRTISFLRSLQIIVNTLLKSIPAMGSIVLLLFLVLYIFSIIGRLLYAETLPDKFGTIWLSLFSMFQLITLDDWFEFYEGGRREHPSMIVYLIVFIVLETFIFINLFIAVIVSNLQASQRQTRLRRQRKIQQRHQMAQQNIDQDLEELNRRKSDYAGGPKGSKTDDKDIDHYYPDHDIPHQQKQLLSRYFQLLASMENNFELYTTQQHALDEMVDLLIPKDDLFDL